ncbi:hypothetical protein T03_19 [Trichinella britovi]|uniref:Uncharacterized protein n=1 Tax=Trichinella britovi TaxID=45882 RepID=A0A0V1D604_TRIBR|nr:hypothetical protein T03_19 [Trichinella britovi]
MACGHLSANHGILLFRIDRPKNEHRNQPLVVHHESFWKLSSARLAAIFYSSLDLFPLRQPYQTPILSLWDNRNILHVED